LEQIFTALVPSFTEVIAAQQEVGILLVLGSWEQLLVMQDIVK
jgi:hypothetical protein